MHVCTHSALVPNSSREVALEQAKPVTVLFSPHSFAPSKAGAALFPSLPWATRAHSFIPGNPWASSAFPRLTGPEVCSTDRSLSCQSVSVCSRMKLPTEEPTGVLQTKLLLDLSDITEPQSLTPPRSDLASCWLGQDFIIRCLDHEWA